MEKTTTAQRLKQVMDARDMRQVDILRAAEPFCKKYGVKLGKNDLSQYVSGKVVPGQDKLTVLGLALNVNEAWLMGYNVPAERKETPITGEGDGQDGEFVQLFNLLSDEQKDLILHAIRGLLSDR